MGNEAGFMHLHSGVIRHALSGCSTTIVKCTYVVASHCPARALARGSLVTWSSSMEIQVKLTVKITCSNHSSPRTVHTGMEEPRPGQLQSLLKKDHAALALRRGGVATRYADPKVSAASAPAHGIMCITRPCS